MWFNRATGIVVFASVALGGLVVVVAVVGAWRAFVVACVVVSFVVGIVHFVASACLAGMAARAPPYRPSLH